MCPNRQSSSSQILPRKIMRRILNNQPHISLSRKSNRSLDLRHRSHIHDVDGIAALHFLALHSQVWMTERTCVHLFVSKLAGGIQVSPWNTSELTSIGESALEHIISIWRFLGRREAGSTADMPSSLPWWARIPKERSCHIWCFGSRVMRGELVLAEFRLELRSRCSIL